MACALVSPGVGHANFSCGAWNLESGDSDYNLLASQVAAWSDVGVWGFSEVLNETSLEIMGASLNAANPDAQFRGIIGTTGRQDRLAIIFASNLFDCEDAYELQHINVGGTLRAPLVARLREKATGKVFLFVANHFYRGKRHEEARRDQQSRLLREWARQQDCPVIAVGDFNFDCEVEYPGECNNAYNILLDGDVFKWAMPDNPMRTQCNRKYNSILDFVFVSGQAKNWISRSTILNATPDACDDDSRKSDHRPIRVQFTTF